MDRRAEHLLLLELDTSVQHPTNCIGWQDGNRLQ